MALSASTVWNIQTVATIGADNNGGGFVTGAAGSDYSAVIKRVSPTESINISTTDGVGNGTTTFTSATGNFTAALVGNIICLEGGTGSLVKTWRQVTAVGSAVSITVDATVAAGTGITMNIGGPLASLGMAGNPSVSGNRINIKNGAYAITSASSNVADGCFVRASVNISIFGYENTVNDFSANRPVLTASGISTFTMISVGTTATIVANLELNGASLTGSRGINLSGGFVYLCKISNCLNSAFFTAAIVDAINCEATGCTTAGAGFNTFSCINCYAHDNTVAGFISGFRYIFCIADTNTGATTDGFTTNASNVYFFNCIAYLNGRDGFRLGAGQNIIQNCIAEDNVAVGFNSQNNTVNLWLNNAAFSNATDFTIGTGANSFNRFNVTLSASAFTSPSTGDFSLNSTAGGGADCKAVGFPGVFPGGLSTGFMDIGTIQAQSSSTPTATSLVLQGSKVLPYGSNYY